MGDIFECHICGSSFVSLKIFTDHYANHKNVSNVDFPCCFVNCKKTWKTYNGFKTHYVRFHKNKSKKVHFQIENKNLACNECKATFSYYKILIGHLKSHLKSGVRITCPHKSCSRIFSKITSFTSHLSRYHTLTKIKNKVGEIVPIDSDNTNKDIAHEIRLTELPESVMYQPENFESFVRDTSLFFMRLQAQHNISSNVVQIIFDELNKFCFRTLDSSLSYLSQKLITNLGLPPETIKRFLLDTYQQNELIKVQEVLKSDYLRKVYFKKEFNFIKPVCVRLGYNKFNMQTFFHYVPILKSLTTFLGNESVLSQLMHPIGTTEGHISDYKDGFYFKEHQFWNSEKLALEILLYQDSFEVVNPLGSARNKHKILALYFALGNLHFYNRSKINAMQLVLLCKEKDFKYFGQKLVFQPLIDDLKILETSGIYVPIIGHIKGSIIFIIGDNLGSHTVGGYSENFSSGSICRFCNITVEEFREKPYSLSAPERTAASYNDAVQLVESGECTEVNGVKFNSIFNSLSYFHVCFPGMPPCIGHDVFEGIVPYDLALIFKHFIKVKHLFTYEILNRRIHKFPYKKEDAASKPIGIINNKDKVAGHAVQNWCLLRFITFILDEFVSDKSDPVWKFMCLLQEIVSIITAKSFTNAQVCYLKLQIEEYLEERKKLFPDIPLRPKHHYILHYPALMLRCGPLIWLWTMRFESKHSFFKKAIRQTNNCINITWSMSEKHQLHQSCLQSGQYFDDPIQINGEKYVPEKFSEEIQRTIKGYFHFSTNLSVNYSVVLHGTEFEVGQAILIEYEFPKAQFGLIHIILSHDDDVIFVVEVFNSQKLSNQFVFKLENCSSSLMCVKYVLQTALPMNVYDIKGAKYLFPKSAFAN